MSRQFATILSIIAFFAFQLVPLIVSECPLCHSSTAEEVRSGLINTSIDGHTLPALILPFAILAFTVWMIQIDWDEVFKSKSKF